MNLRGGLLLTLATILAAAVPAHRANRIPHGSATNKSLCSPGHISSGVVMEASNAAPHSEANPDSREAANAPPLCSRTALCCLPNFCHSEDDNSTWGPANGDSSFSLKRVVGTINLRVVG